MRSQRFEILNTKVNIKVLQNQLYRDVMSLPPCDRVGYRGWSLLSSNGDYKDGWHTGSSFYNDQHQEEQSQILIDDPSDLSMKPGDEYVVPTQILKGYFQTIIRLLIELGLQPHRAQIALLKAGEKLAWHRDSHEGDYCVRLHIPIITNESCYFEYTEERIHLKADGSIYLLDGSHLHRFVNEGFEDRYHLICYVRDTKGYSNNFKCLN